MGRLEIKEKHTTDYALLFGKNAKKLVYEPLLNKFETLKKKIPEEAKIVSKGEEKKEQQEGSGGGEQESDPFWQLLKQQQVQDEKEQKKKKEQRDGEKQKDKESDEKKQDSEEGLIESRSVSRIKNKVVDVKKENNQFF